MNQKYKLAIFAVYFFGLVLVAALYLNDNNIAVLNPKGTIASQERSLIIIATLLMLVVVIPVYILTFSIAWKYRATNKKAKYSPDWDHHPGLEFTWWALPGAIILVLSVLAWRSSHQLDPFRSIDSPTPPMAIQVVALQWKWLFIYPQQDIASVNFVQFPQNRPIDFAITSDAPMNSFWIPQLGGQVYAMSGMTTHLHLMASGIGSYDGSSANISGKGFAGMRFIAKSASSEDFNRWVQLVQQTRGPLTLDQYSQLAKPSENNPPTYFGSAQEGLFRAIVAKYMHPSSIQSAPGYGRAAE